MQKTIILIGIIVLLLFPPIAASEVIDVVIKGMDDGVKTSKQQDFREAEMNAKLQAIERAGTEISSITKVVNFQTKFDMVQTKAEAALLPGYQVMDLGYQTDGTYLVVLTGKVKKGDEEKAPTIAGLWKVSYGNPDIRDYDQAIRKDAVVELRDGENTSFSAPHPEKGTRWWRGTYSGNQLAASMKYFIPTNSFKCSTVIEYQIKLTMSPSGKTMRGAVWETYKEESKGSMWDDYCTTNEKRGSKRIFFTRMD